MSCEKKSILAGKPVEPDYVCRNFVRIPQSLIEEPEVCEWCEAYSGGCCCRDNDQPTQN